LPRTTDLGSRSSHGEEVTMTKDPVCGMQIDERQASGNADYQGQTYYFCSPGCQQKFEQNPDQYARKTA
jgi:YHS domain-containing protein